MKKGPKKAPIQESVFSVICGACSAVVPSITVARAAGWKRFRWDVIRWFECPMCTAITCRSANVVEIDLEAV